MKTRIILYIMIISFPGKLLFSQDLTGIKIHINP